MSETFMRSFRDPIRVINSPDKNPNVKGVQERFARLGVVGTILRNPEGRER